MRRRRRCPSPTGRSERVGGPGLSPRPARPRELGKLSQLTEDGRIRRTLRAIESRPTLPFSGRTAWARNLETPLRSFLRTETGSAAVLVAAAVAALLWVNVDASSYERVWQTVLSIRVGGKGISEDLRYWVNSGLMAFFFFVVGLEARR